MKKRVLFLIGCGLSLFLVAGPVFAASPAIQIYVDQYAGDKATSQVTKQLVEASYNRPVKLTQASVGVSFVGVAQGPRAVFLAVWLPTTHAAYWKKFKNKVQDLGVLYNGARIGWAVPSYVPKSQLNSIPDLKKPKVAARLNHKIQGISAGSGEMQVSEKAVKKYNLNYTVTKASGAAMTAALARAIKKHQWIVVTAWSPHWMWIRYNLRYLKDPKGVLGVKQHVDSIANPGFKKEAPKVYGLLSRMHYSLKQINTMLAVANKTSYKHAAKHFIKDHPKLVHYWVTGHKSS